MTKELRHIIEHTFIQFIVTEPCGFSVTKKKNGFYRVQYVQSNNTGVEVSAYVTKRGIVFGEREFVFDVPSSCDTFDCGLLIRTVTGAELAEGKECIGFAVDCDKNIKLQLKGEEIE